MQEEYASQYREAEETHWWFLGRRDMIRRLIKSSDRDTDVLEIGCSGGPLIAQINQEGFRSVSGIDVSLEAVRLCRERGLASVSCADARATGFPDARFGLLISSDVLEHIDDEDATLREWHRLLKPQGILIVFVPAFRFLWGPHDDVNQHCRRYSRKQLVEALLKNGFRVQRSSYWSLSLFPVLGMVRLYERITGKPLKSVSEVRKPKTFFNRLFQRLLFAENAVLERGLNFPFGTSMFAIARKP